MRSKRSCPGVQALTPEFAGDAKYGDESFNREMSVLGLKRLYLHAESICFTLPDVRAYDVHAPLDSSLEESLTRLEKI